MIAKDYTERLSAVALSVGLINLCGKCVSGVRHLNALTEIAWEDANGGIDRLRQGNRRRRTKTRHGISTVASEKNREL